GETLPPISAAGTAGTRANRPGPSPSGESSLFRYYEGGSVSERKGQAMITVINDFNRVVSIPSWVVDLESFRRWADADDFPEDGRAWYLKGEVWIDMSKQQIFTHILVKTEFTIVLGNLVKTAGLGLFLGDGALLSNIAADISGVPDAMFVFQATLQSDRVHLVEGWEAGHVEL